MQPSEILIAPASREAAAGASRSSEAREVLDVFLGIAGDGAGVLRDLALALVELGRQPGGKAIVRLYDKPWEMCVERLGSVASLSVYRGGADPEVAVYDRWVPWGDFVDGVRDAAGSYVAKGSARPLLTELRAAEQELAGLSHGPPSEPPPPPSTVVIEEHDVPIAFGAEFALRAGSAGAGAEPSIERADFHALLFRGRLGATVRGRNVDLGEGHPFLVAERLLETSRRALEAWERGQACHLRSEVGGIVLGVRVVPDGALALTLSSRAGGERATCTFPALGMADLVEASLSFGRALVRAILRRDRSQGANLRLSAFRRQVRETSDALRDVCRQDAKINPRPEPYRTFATAQHRTKPRTPSSLSGARLRYTSRWRALVPGIDLRSTFLCGDRFILGTAAATFCLDRTTGQVLWRIETSRATSVVTPGGLARLHPDGALTLHDYATGEVTLRSWLAPRIGGPPSGAVVNVQGLPRLLVLTEGDRHLVAVDLASGEPRWRYAWGRRGTPRLKRGGRLLYLTAGDSALSAIDVVSGALVWRVRDRLRFHAAPTIDRDELFALAGGTGGAATLHAIDPFSGTPRWSQPLPGGPGGCTVEGSVLSAGSVAACTLRDRRGLTLVAFDAKTGTPRWTSPGRVAPTGTSWLAVDDLFIGNAPTGELIAIDAATGEPRYRHVLGGVHEVDVPRRLEPVLRSGALFLPHSDVHVFSPADGTELAVIGPCEAIPDLLRVDERCDVYVAEESGHVVCFGAGPRLSLVRS